jgi:hypothetical protein
VHPGCIRTARLSSCGVLRASEIIVRVDVIGLLCAQFRCDLDLLVLFESMCRFLCYSFGWRRIATKVHTVYVSQCRIVIWIHGHFAVF